MKLLLHSYRLTERKEVDVLKVKRIDRIPAIQSEILFEGKSLKIFMAT